MRKRQPEPTYPEISIGPHPARPDWRVLRVSYPVSYERHLDIGGAISVLLAPPPPHQQAALAAEDRRLRGDP